MTTLDELIRDHSEVRDLLEAYGEKVPSDAKAARKLLLERLEQVGETRLLSTLFMFARGFAQMSREVMDYCETMGVGIAGEIQVRTGEIFVEQSALNADWAFGGEARWTLDAEARAYALSSELAGLVQRLDLNDLLQERVERRETGIGKAWRQSPHPMHQVYRQVYRDVAERTRRYSVFATEDYEAFKAIADTLAEAQKSLTGAPLPLGVGSAFVELEAQCSAVLDEMAQTQLESTGETNPEIRTIADEIHIVSAQVRSLAEEVTEGQRVERGFSDFVRTDFWPARWRIYELWLLVRVLKVLEQAGGDVRLLGVDKTTWHLPYARASDPVAECIFDEGVVDVYYQLFRESDEAADMPDIAILPRDGRAIMVLDPKHGLSYNRGKVQSVLSRYARHLKADLTAIVNYFPKKSYPFDAVWKGARCWLLASDVALHSAHARRLELRLADVLLARGYAASPPLAERPAAPAKKRQPASTSYLFYWAQEAREVDEPKGPWIVGPRGGPTPLPAFGDRIGEKLDAIDATPEGDACILRIEDQCLFLQAGRKKPRPFWEYKGYKWSAAWDRKGTNWLLNASDHIVLFARDGEQAKGVDKPGGRRDETEAAWDASGQHVLCACGSDYRIEVHCLTQSGDWEMVHEQETKLDRHSLWKRPKVLRTAMQAVRLGGEMEQVPESPRNLLAVSPSGRYQALQEPVSLRFRDGVTLLTIRDAHEDCPYPLVRFFGQLQGDIYWCADESQLAFMSRRRSEHGWSEERMLTVRLGDRHARAASMPGQEPSCFAWLSRQLLRPFMT